MKDKKMIAKLILCSLISIEMFTASSVHAVSESLVNNKSEYIIAKNDKQKGSKKSSKKADDFKIEKYVKVFDGQYLEIPSSINNNDLTSISISSRELKKEDNRITIFGKNSYSVENNKIYINPLQDRDIISVTYKGNSYNFKYSKETDKIEPVSEADKNVTYKVRLKGAFEPALINQKKYDGISAATMSSSEHKNSNVVVQATEKENPTEEDWKLLKDFSNLKVKSKTMSGNSGMNVNYSEYDSSITLNGTPLKYGTFPATITIEDSSGNEYQSNSLDFKIFGLDEKLEEQMVIKNFKKTQDNKYMWDMEPWYMENFGNGDTVNVPTDLKAIFGSHTSGVYGVLGTPNKDREKMQTLIVGAGCNLTIQNMKILSSVKIIVKDGGRLNLRDSSIYGRVEVEDGSTLVINYDEYNKKFLNGTSINGQIELKEGSTLENSLVYSNTNSLTDSKVANKNVEPVVLVTGNANIKGNVYIRGDESPSGDDPETSKVYAGQKALGIKGASLNIAKDSTLGAYGGGRFATTSMGANAVTLEDGTIKGDGKLIAIGGSGATFEGGSAVAGNGSIENDEVYMVAGITYGNKGILAKAYDENVKISKSTTGFAKDSKYIQTSTDFDQPGYWKDSQRVPEENLAEYDKNSFTYNDKTIEREPKQKDPIDKDEETPDNSEKTEHPKTEEKDKNPDKEKEEKPEEKTPDNVDEENIDEDEEEKEDSDIDEDNDLDKNSDKENNEDEEDTDEGDRYNKDEKNDSNLSGKKKENKPQQIIPDIDIIDDSDTQNDEEIDDNEDNSVDSERIERNKLLYNKLKTALDKYKIVIEKLEIYKEIYNKRADKKEKVSQTIDELLVIADRIIERGDILLEKLSN